MAIDNRLIFLKSKNVFLKVLEEKDLIESEWISWFNDYERCKFNQHHRFPVTYGTQLQVMAELNQQKIMLGIVNSKLNETICGVISIQNINFINGTAELGIMLDKDSEKFPEIFADSVSLIIHHAFTELRLRKISIGSINSNLIRVFEKLFGFIAEGILKDQVFKDLKYRDVYIAAVFIDTMKFCHEEP